MNVANLYGVTNKEATKEEMVSVQGTDSCSFKRLSTYSVTAYGSSITALAGGALREAVNKAFRITNYPTKDADDLSSWHGTLAIILYQNEMGVWRPFLEKEGFLCVNAGLPSCHGGAQSLQLWILPWQQWWEKEKERKESGQTKDGVTVEIPVEKAA